MEVFISPFGSYTLARIPAIPRDTLRAWDAADELILSYLAENERPQPDTRILVVNDHFAALATALHQYQVQSWSDSLIAHQAIAHNAKLNPLPESQLAKAIPSIDAPSGSIDIVLIKVPKTLALLKEQLRVLKPLLTPDSLVIGAGMVKHMPGSAIQLFEDQIGSTHTSLAKKKARLIFSQVEARDSDHSQAERYQFTDSGLQLSHHANVFSKDKLDIGARFMLEQFEQLPKAEQIIDLGCGNGVLGIVAQHQLPQGQIHFVDESYMAVDSARQNYQRAVVDDQAHYWVSNCLEQYTGPSADLILCNPPFHQQHAVGDHIAWQMLKQGYQTLSSGGQFWLVGNRHLGYHVKMKKLFGNCKQIAGNKKFVVLSSIK